MKVIIEICNPKYDVTYISDVTEMDEKELYNFKSLAKESEAYISMPIKGNTTFFRTGFLKECVITIIIQKEK